MSFALSYSSVSAQQLCKATFGRYFDLDVWHPIRTRETNRASEDRVLENRIGRCVNISPTHMGGRRLCSVMIGNPAAEMRGAGPAVAVKTMEMRSQAMRGNLIQGMYIE